MQIFGNGTQTQFAIIFILLSSLLQYLPSSGNSNIISQKKNIASGNKTWCCVVKFKDSIIVVLDCFLLNEICFLPVYIFFKLASYLSSFHGNLLFSSSIIFFRYNFFTDLNLPRLHPDNCNVPSSDCISRSSIRIF